MKRRLVILAGIVFSLLVVGGSALVVAINRSIALRDGPVHHFTIPASESFLTDDRAASVARAVMDQDGFPRSRWELMKDDRSKAHDGRQDRFLARNSINPNAGYVLFVSANAPTLERVVNLELRDGEITAQGSVGK